MQSYSITIFHKAHQNFVFSISTINNNKLVTGCLSERREGFDISNTKLGKMEIFIINS